jgi:EF-P beta-lysylation protein EpmB
MALGNPPQIDWKRELAESFRTADQLFEAGYVTAPERDALAPVLARYQFLLPRYYATLIDRNDPRCPIRAQAIPSVNELDETSGFSPDPLKDLAHHPQRRITHRYPNRLLLHLTPNCSMYCRFCFRKTLLNDLKTALFDGSVAEGVGYIRAHPEVNEVIFSGGDPFLMNAPALAELLDEISTIAHVKRLRFHTRVPVTLPRRIDREFTEALRRAERPLVVVCHFNHPKEITEQSAEAAQRLKAIPVTLLNQTVLLKDVNDQAETLIALSEQLFDIGVLPYYLHHPDRAEGTAYFDVALNRGLDLHRQLKANLPGYLVPRYVVDVVGAPYKTDAAELRP